MVYGLIEDVSMTSQNSCLKYIRCLQGEVISNLAAVHAVLLDWLWLEANLKSEAVAGHAGGHGHGKLSCLINFVVFQIAVLVTHTNY